MKRPSTDFNEAKVLLYDPCGFTISEWQVENGGAYGACSFLLNKRRVKFRAAKTTPTKPGLFTATWKRNKSGITAPFDAGDLDYLVISVSQNRCSGQFVFPTSVLTERGIVTHTGIQGKRGTRVYPPWAKDLNTQAQKTQQWQCRFFTDLTAPFKSTIAIEQCRKYFGLTQ